MLNTYRRRTVLSGILVAFGAALIPKSSIAGENFEILMLNKDPNNSKRKMIFSDEILSVNVGDTVIFKPEDKGHNSESIKGMIPNGATKWRGKMNKEVSVTFEIPGFYGYHCKPHASMGMVGLIVVEGPGKLDNLEAVTSVKHRGKAKKAWAKIWEKAEAGGFTS